MKWHLSKHEKSCLKSKEKLKCDICGKYETIRNCNMKRHRLTCINRLANAALQDDNNFNKGASCSNSSRVSVVNLPSSKSAFTCDICGRPHGNMTELIAHRNVHSSVLTGIPTAMSNDFASIKLTKHAFGGHVLEYDLTPH